MSHFAESLVQLEDVRFPLSKVRKVFQRTECVLMILWMSLSKHPDVCPVRL